MSVAYQVVHRRNNSAPGIALLVAGLLILLSAFLPLIHVTGPNLDFVFKRFGLTLTPGGTFDADPVEFWFWIAGFVFGFGLILLATRVRGLGIFWRILALIPLLLMGAWAGFMWYVVSKPQEALVPETDGIVDDAIRVTAMAAQDWGLYDVSAGAGLIILSAALIIGVVALFLPAVKSQRYIAIPITGPLPVYPHGQITQQPYPTPQQPPYQQHAPYPPRPQNPPQYPPTRT